MNYMVSYDVSNDKIRRLISDYLKNIGFIRIQKSVFLGEVKLEIYEKMTKEIDALIDKKSDSICCIPISKNDYFNILSIGKLGNYRIYEEEILYI
ncbi:CRISPR-associated endonuclease Cas2 [Fusobacterium sp.]|uniref:CRISPR-associated endonuclease Cas2 n=1 Tax=Fusobacterium sp. TaxID=68766 RepID=UPI0025C318DF|nr:CRISPR-associated endonuclease Cas2 [Fusobacterium sp.]